MSLSGRPKQRKSLHPFELFRFRREEKLDKFTSAKLEWTSELDGAVRYTSQRRQTASEVSHSTLGSRRFPDMRKQQLTFHVQIRTRMQM